MFHTRITSSLVINNGQGCLKPVKNHFKRLYRYNQQHWFSSQEHWDGQHEMSSLLCVARPATSGKYCSRESENRLLELIIAHDHLRDKIISPNWIHFFLFYYNPNNNTGRSFLAIVHKVSLPGCLVETFAPIIHRAQWDQTSNQREMDAMCLRIPPRNIETI